jgi:hypothetical protein
MYPPGVFVAPLEDAIIPPDAAPEEDEGPSLEEIAHNLVSSANSFMIFGSPTRMFAAPDTAYDIIRLLDKIAEDFPGFVQAALLKRKSPDYRISAQLADLPDRIKRAKERNRKLMTLIGQTEFAIEKEQKCQNETNPNQWDLDATFLAASLRTSIKQLRRSQAAMESVRITNARLTREDTDIMAPFPEEGETPLETKRNMTMRRAIQIEETLADWQEQEQRLTVEIWEKREALKLPQPAIDEKVAGKLPYPRWARPLAPPSIPGGRLALRDFKLPKRKAASAKA